MICVHIATTINLVGVKKKKKRYKERDKYVPLTCMPFIVLCLIWNALYNRIYIRLRIRKQHGLD